MKTFFIILTLLGSISFSFEGESKIKLEKMASGMGIPWGMVFINNNELLISEKNGHFKILNVATKKLTEVKGKIEVYDSGQGGLLDVELAADFAHSGTIYYSYAKKVKGGYSTALGRAHLSANTLNDIKDLFVAEPAVKGDMHFGSRLVVTDKEIFISLGERNERHEAQNLKSHLGKVLRLNHQGQALKDNPFYNTANAKKEIYSYGHRNPQGLLKHPQTGEMWLSEHGPQGGDEINLLKPGKNYGWPVVTFGREYWGPKIGEGTTKSGMEKPVYQFTPSIAPCGFSFYIGSKIPALKNHFISGALKLTHLNATQLENGQIKNEKRLFVSKNFRIREVAVSADELIYFSTDRGEIYRLSPSRE